MGSTLPLEWVERGCEENLNIKKAQSYDIYLYILKFYSIFKKYLCKKKHINY